MVVEVAQVVARLGVEDAVERRHGDGSITHRVHRAAYADQLRTDAADLAERPAVGARERLLLERVELVADAVDDGEVAVHHGVRDHVGEVRRPMAPHAALGLSDA